MRNLFCKKCDAWNLQPKKIVQFRNGTEHFMAKCRVHGIVYLPKTEGNIKLFDDLPYEDSKPLRKQHANIKQRDIWSL